MNTSPPSECRTTTCGSFPAFHSRRHPFLLVTILHEKYCLLKPATAHSSSSTLSAASYTTNVFSDLHKFSRFLHLDLIGIHLERIDLGVASFFTTMPLTQTQGGAYHPTSPHSSSGAADSFKGTPDTRLTTFSPDNTSTKSAQASNSLGLINTGSMSAIGPRRSPSTTGLCGNYLPASLQFDKDPFVSSSFPTAKSLQKLSPTATSFFPVASPMRSRGPASEPTPSSKTKRDMYHPARDFLPNDSPDEEPTHSTYVHAHLSTETGLSRCLVISHSYGTLKAQDVDRYIMVFLQTKRQS
jgi:hypothetical protein